MQSLGMFELFSIELQSLTRVIWREGYGNLLTDELVKEAKGMPDVFFARKVPSLGHLHDYYRLMNVSWEPL
jgi:hypothetical protein